MRGIYSRELHAKFFCMLSLNARSFTFFVKHLKAFMFERFDHERSVARCAPQNKRKLTPRIEGKFMGAAFERSEMRP